MMNDKTIILSKLIEDEYGNIGQMELYFLNEDIFLDVEIFESLIHYKIIKPKLDVDFNS